MLLRLGRGSWLGSFAVGGEGSVCYFMEPCHPFVGVCDRDQLQRLQQCRYVRRGLLIDRPRDLPYRVGAAVVSAAPLALCLMFAGAYDAPARLIFSQFWLLLSCPLASPPELGTLRSCGCTPYLVLSAQRLEIWIIVGGTLAYIFGARLLDRKSVV